MSVRKHGERNGWSICTDGKFVEINKIIILKLHV